ncbi:MAG: electron transfer flavoprotein subunit beta/FixA family protein [Thermomicrobiales bacterium]
MPNSIVVLIKQVPDMNAVRVDRASGKAVVGGQRAISSFDEYAIEEALRLKEAHGGEVTVVCAGPASVKDAVSRALAMGCDRGVIVPVDNVDDLDTLAVASILAAHLAGMTYDVILTGQNSDDSATGHVGPQVAELLSIPQISSMTKLEANGNHLTLHRDTEDGQQIVEVDTPVLLMAMTGLNEPRYPSLKGIMAAKRKPVDQGTPAPANGERRLAWSEPVAAERTSGGTIVQDVAPTEAAGQLVAWLKERKLL